MSVILNDARTLADFMLSLNIDDYAQKQVRRSSYNHLGALFTDIVLQSGLNYNTVVKPRVARVLHHFPTASTLDNLVDIINRYGPHYFLNWKSTIKTQRLMDVIAFCQDYQLPNENALRAYLSKASNRENFLAINGVGPKTVDYAMKLLGMECVAVDRHVFSFIKEAGINRQDYHEVKMIVEYAADLLNISRICVDNFIWNSMSKQGACSQTALAF